MVASTEVRDVSEAEAYRKAELQRREVFTHNWSSTERSLTVEDEDDENLLSSGQRTDDSCRVTASMCAPLLGSLSRGKLKTYKQLRSMQ